MAFSLNTPASKTHSVMPYENSNEQAYKFIHFYATYSDESADVNVINVVSVSGQGGRRDRPARAFFLQKIRRIRSSIIA